MSNPDRKRAKKAKNEKIEKNKTSKAQGKMFAEAKEFSAWLKEKGPIENWPHRDLLRYLKEIKHRMNILVKKGTPEDKQPAVYAWWLGGILTRIEELDKQGKIPPPSFIERDQEAWDADYAFINTMFRQVESVEKLQKLVNELPPDPPENLQNILNELPEMLQKVERGIALKNEYGTAKKLMAVRPEIDWVEVAKAAKKEPEKAKELLKPLAEWNYKISGRNGAMMALWDGIYERNEPPKDKNDPYWDFLE